MSLVVSKQENAKFITDRLWFRFVSGTTTPPPSLADSFASRDISSLVNALVHSSAWTNPANSLVKVARRVVRRSVPGPQGAAVSNERRWHAVGTVPDGPSPIQSAQRGRVALRPSVAERRRFQYRFELASSIVQVAISRRSRFPNRRMVQACADWLGVAEWSRRTASTLAAATGTPSELALAALLHPEYAVSA